MYTCNQQVTNDFSDSLSISEIIRAGPLTLRLPPPLISLVLTVHFPFSAYLFFVHLQTRVEDMVDGSLEGLNQTILAYGQTGSGKTYTMGTGFAVDLPAKYLGVIPRSAKYMFAQMDVARTEATARGTTVPEFTVKVSFLELYRDSFFDLFDSKRGRREPSNIKIRDDKYEDGSVQVRILGVTELEVQSADELLDHLRRGSLERVTERTAMNATSSRSHAVFTIFVTHRRVLQRDAFDPPTPATPDELGNNDHSEPVQGAETAEGAEPMEDIITTTAKFNFVDLAGSERLKRTRAEGDRAKEGININQGLFVLGNVISALGDPTKRASFVPYRDSKLTRILQDSLGGNSSTLMIACISPVDADQCETINTLQYANRARNIKNKAVVNQDSASRQIQLLQDTIQKLTMEVMEYRQGRRTLTANSTDADVMANDLFVDLAHYKEENEKLKRKVSDSQNQVNLLTEAMNTLARTQVQARLAGTDELELLANPDTATLLQQNLALQSQLAVYQRRAVTAPGGNSDEIMTPSRPTSNRPRTSQQRLMQMHRITERARALVVSETATNPIEAQVMTITHASNEEAGVGFSSDDDDNNDHDNEAANSADVSEEEDVEQNGLYNSHNADTAAELPVDGLAETNRQLVETLFEQIKIHDELLTELSARDNELEKQRQLYEEKLVAAQQEKIDLQEEMRNVRSKLTELKGQKGSEVKQRKKEFKTQLSKLEHRISGITEQSKRQARFEEEKSYIQTQKNKLTKSLEEVKKKHRDAIEQAKKDLQQVKDREAARQKELQTLRKQHDKQILEHRRIKEENKVKSALLERTSKENQKLKTEMDALKTKELAVTRKLQAKLDAMRNQQQQQQQQQRQQQQDGPATISPGLAPLAVSPPKSRLGLAQRMSSGLFRKKSVHHESVALNAKRKLQTVFNKEISCVLMYNSLEENRSVLEERRRQLADEVKELRIDLGKTLPQEQEYGALEDELERLEGQIELLTADIDAQNGELLRLQKQGIRSCADADDLSTNGVANIKQLEVEEARQMLKEFFVQLIRSERELQKQRLAVKRMEAELQNKTSIMKALAHNGMSAGTETAAALDDVASAADSTALPLFSTLGQRSRSFSVDCSVSNTDGSPRAVRRERSLSPKPRSVSATDSKAGPDRLVSPRLNRKRKDAGSTPLVATAPAASSTHSPLAPNVFPQTLRQPMTIKGLLRSKK